MAVRDNAHFVADIAREHGSFGKFLAQWPAGDQVGLLELLAKRGARLGGRTGQYFLRFIGKDGFVTSTDVVACLRDAGLDISENPTSKRDLGEDPGRSSTPGRRRPACRSRTSRASAPCRSARTTTPRRCAWTNDRASSSWKARSTTRVDDKPYRLALAGHLLQLKPISVPARGGCWNIKSINPPCFIRDNSLALEIKKLQSRYILAHIAYHQFGIVAATGNMKYNIRGCAVAREKSTHLIWYCFLLQEDRLI